MFKIIGADQKQYGPISEVQIRQWIADGRLNAHSQAQREGTSDWQLLSAFPEFAEIFNPSAADPSSTFTPPPTPGPMGASIPTGTREAALSAVKGPAIALIIIASLGLAYNLFLGLFGVVSGGTPNMYGDMTKVPPELRHFMEGPMIGLAYIFFAAIYGFILFGAIKMMRLQSHGLAMAASVLIMLPCSCCCVLGLGFGIWAIIVLNKAEIKSQFS
jgi:hypothetical protein